MKNKNRFLFLVSTLVVLIILTVHFESLLALFSAQSEVWLHIRTHLLAEFIKNTLGIVAITMFFSGIIGTLLAYGISCFEFPFRTLLGRLLYLPLAIPPYIGAYVYVNMLQPNGYLHHLFGGTRVNSFWTAALVFTLFLFPYVFISVKGFISHDMSSYIENARLLGKKEWQIFLFVILPIAKTSIITGSIFTGLEVLGDFGVVSYLNLRTFSTAIFQSWFNFRDLDSALRLSGMVIVPVFLLLLFKGIVLRFKYQSATTSKLTALSRKRMSLQGMLAFYLFSGSIIFLSLILPLLRLFTWAGMVFQNIRWDHMGEIVFNSFWYSLLATVIILVLALVLATYTRTAPKYLAEVYGKITLISYALPGPVVAIVVLFFMLNISDWFHLSLTTTTIMLIFGYVVRYLGIAYESIENGYKKLGMKHHQVSRTLGKGYYKTLLWVDLPMLKPFLLSGAILVFIDLIKELPLTLALRPFNFHTLATRAYQFASDEMLPESSIPSLIIVAISMGMTLILFQNKRGEHQ